MLLVHRATIALFVGISACLSAGCQTVSTGYGYEPANCAMVGSRCSRDR